MYGNKKVHRTTSKRIKNTQIENHFLFKFNKNSIQLIYQKFFLKIMFYTFNINNYILLDGSLYYFLSLLI